MRRIKLTSLLAVGLVLYLFALRRQYHQAEQLEAAQVKSAGGNLGLLHPQNQDDSLGMLEVKNQHAHYTRFNRYPDEYRMVAKLSSGRNSKLLSFGCSKGQEALTLALKYFKNSTIYGVDVEDRVLSRAKELVKRGNDPNFTSKFKFFNGMKEPIQKYAPYDVIFANSVLHLNPVARPNCNMLNEFLNCTIEEFSKAYSFETFEATIIRLDQALGVGGLLAINNANYLFTETRVAERYQVFPEKCSRENKVPCVNRTSHEWITDNKRHCVFMKTS